jgi:caa(3)-type oxidase subunit IV
MFEIPALTLITAFGIACVKAFLVLKNFMHLNVEKRVAVYILSTCLVFMFLLFAASAPDVMKHEGDNWHKPAPKVVATTGGAHH